MSALDAEDRLLPPGVHAAEVSAWQGGHVEARPDWLAEEVPVALVCNGISQAVMLASPTDLEDFALGFALTEGWLASPAELYGVERVEQAQGLELRLQVAAACEWRLRQRRRSLAGRSGCGLCGIESLAQLQRELAAPPLLTPLLHLPAAALGRAQQALLAGQALQQLTGATHAAAWCSPQGEVLLLREDVGRHNALDKLIGALLKAGHDRRQGFVAITSRASYEMVQKAAMAGVGVLAAASAPTALALRCAQACGLLLAGFVRGERLVAYTFAERLL
ncbi:FdhD protein [Paucibacter oligotrophus]|uniref:Sulfur carrier protein FdhD n=1 Tax=Roseateles oligotrophus TaxID=1769250 RepID=A0A840L7Q7_9BURK|nr:formate dehydrogenase accessory sulfurtransferase FdhD [Roseateles oligotrophus]MBB4842695.1 FdhD protein [Roseateles oligotrophus]